MQNREKELLEIASTHLGQKGGEGYRDQYDPSLLVRIPRIINREIYGMEDSTVPFVGFDDWNCYEVSLLTNNGLPVTGVLKIVVPASSKYHVESKALKLYLNSFNMTRMGNSMEESWKRFEETVRKDLEKLLETEIRLKVFTEQDPGSSRHIMDDSFLDLLSLVSPEMLRDFSFKEFTSDPNLLKIVEGERAKRFEIKTDLLRSNCRVTHQPDWGTIYISILGKETPTFDSLLEYIVSHRTVAHFHEEICEMVYKHLWDRCHPDQLLVACSYTRRGGIDIMPVRASSEELIPIEFKSEDYRIKKTLRG